MSRSRCVGPGAAVGVTEPMIHDLVHAFYAKVRVDPALGPIFNRVIGDGWTSISPSCAISGRQFC